MYVYMYVYQFIGTLTGGIERERQCDGVERSQRLPRRLRHEKVAGTIRLFAFIK